MEYKYHKYKFTLDSEGFITSFYAVAKDSEDYDWYGQAAEFSATHDGLSLAFGCVKLVDGELVVDETKKAEIIAKQEQQKREQEKEATRVEAQCYYTAMETDTLLPESNANASSNFERIKKFYELGLWSRAMVIEAKDKGLITQTECDEILEG